MEEAVQEPLEIAEDPWDTRQKWLQRGLKKLLPGDDWKLQRAPNGKCFELWVGRKGSDIEALGVFGRIHPSEVDGWMSRGKEGKLKFARHLAGWRDA